MQDLFTTAVATIGFHCPGVLCPSVPGFDISTSLHVPASESLKKELSGKYILVLTCPNGQADFLSTTHFFI